MFVCSVAWLVLSWGFIAAWSMIQITIDIVLMLCFELTQILLACTRDVRQQKRPCILDKSYAVPLYRKRRCLAQATTILVKIDKPA
jgi:hypothetical protein